MYCTRCRAESAKALSGRPDRIPPYSSRARAMSRNGESASRSCAAEVVRLVAPRAVGKPLYVFAARSRAMPISERAFSMRTAWMSGSSMEGSFRARNCRRESRAGPAGRSAARRSERGRPWRRSCMSFCGAEVLARSTFPRHRSLPIRMYRPAIWSFRAGFPSLYPLSSSATAAW